MNHRTCRNFTLKPFCFECLDNQLLGSKAFLESDRGSSSLPCLRSQQMIWGLSVFILLKAAFSQRGLPGAAQDTHKKNCAASDLETNCKCKRGTFASSKTRREISIQTADVKVEGNDFVSAFKNSLLSNAVLRALLV